MTVRSEFLLGIFLEVMQRLHLQRGDLIFALDIRQLGVVIVHDLAAVAATGVYLQHSGRTFDEGATDLLGELLALSDVRLSEDDTAGGLDALIVGVHANDLADRAALLDRKQMLLKLQDCLVVDDPLDCCLRPHHV